MRITFSWENINGTLTPSCSSSIVNHDGVSILSCLLMDDGGMHYLDTLPWINEGILTVDKIKKAGNLKTANWDRDAWGVVLTNDKVQIYSLYDENYFETLNIQAFEGALLAWKDFLQSSPSLSTSKDIKL